MRGAFQYSSELLEERACTGITPRGKSMIRFVSECKVVACGGLRIALSRNSDLYSLSITPPDVQSIAIVCIKVIVLIISMLVLANNWHHPLTKCELFLLLILFIYFIFGSMSFRRDRTEVCP